MSCARWWVTAGAVLAGLSVVTGAFAAHGLDSRLQEIYAGQPDRQIVGMTVPAAYKYMKDFQTAATYQMTHALGMIAIGLLSRARPRRSLEVAGWSFLLGIVLFSGSLYVLVLTGERSLRHLPPIGGVLFLVGWAALACGACPCNDAANEPETVPLNEPPAAAAG